jgi:hypothetical protein
VVPAGLLVGAVACIAFAAAAPPFDARSPRPDSLVYAVDADRRAWWLSFDDTLDEWTRRVLSGASRSRLATLFPRSGTFAWQAPAPRVALGQPAVSVLSDAREGTKRTLRLHVSLPPGTESAVFNVPPDAHVVFASVQGIPFGAEPGDGWLELAFFGPPAEGLDLVLVAESRRVLMTALAQARGLPPELAARLGPRPEDRMPAVTQWNTLQASDMTLAVAGFEL